jgi:glycosyltransferase involved in cell wall biosynthesis
MKKVLIVNTKYKKYGGEDSNFVEEIKFLKKFYEVDYLNFDNSRRLSIFDFVSFFTLSNLSTNKVLKEKIISFKPDIVYVHNTWFKANLGIFDILKKENIKVVLKIHNFRFACTDTFSASKHFNGKEFCYKCGNKKTRLRIFNKYFENSYTKSFFVILYGKKYLNILREYNLKIIALNEFCKDYLIRKGVNKGKVFKNYNPFEISENYTYSATSEYVVYAGSLIEQKGVQELLESWKESKVNLKLLVIGTGKLENELINEYTSKKIEFLGFLKNEKTIELIKNSRAVITATKMFEGQPRLISEASAYGIPSIYPSFGGLDEYFPKDYRLSFKQFDYRDLVEKIILLQNKELLIEESKKIHNYIIENMSLNKLNTNLESIFNSNE